MTGTYSAEALKRLTEQRFETRFDVALPATAIISGAEHSVRVFNVALGGAMFETSAPIAAGSALIFRCGTITVSAVVAWQLGRKTGVRFDRSVADRDVKEQLSRSSAVAARRARKPDPVEFQKRG